MNLRALFLFCAAFCLSCAGAQTREEVPAPSLQTQELEVSEQGLTDFKVTFKGVLGPTTASATLERATYELVVEGKVVEAGEAQLGVTVTPGAPTAFEIREGSRYVANAAELKALDGRAGTLLTAMRGKLFVRVGETQHALDYARSREIRLPRMPKVVLHDVDAGRYSDVEVNGTLYLGVVNPNPFPVKLSELDYVFAIAGKKVVDGIQGRGEQVSPSATGVFEVPFTVNEETYGKDVKKLIASRTLPYQAAGELKGDLFEVPYTLDGEIRLNVSK